MMNSNYGKKTKHWDLKVLKLFSKQSDFDLFILDGSKEDLPILETVFENEKNRSSVFAQLKFK